MFPNEKARLMRIMDSYDIPSVNEFGAKMNFMQRVTWLIEHAGQLPLCPKCGEMLIEDDRRWECVNESCVNCR